MQLAQCRRPTGCLFSSYLACLCVLWDFAKISPLSVTRPPTRIELTRALAVWDRPVYFLVAAKRVALRLRDRWWAIREIEARTYHPTCTTLTSADLLIIRLCCKSCRLLSTARTNIKDACRLLKNCTAKVYKEVHEDGRPLALDFLIYNGQQRRWGELDFVLRCARIAQRRRTMDVGVKLGMVPGCKNCW